MTLEFAEYAAGQQHAVEAQERNAFNAGWKAALRNLMEPQAAGRYRITRTTAEGTSTQERVAHELCRALVGLASGPHALQPGDTWSVERLPGTPEQGAG